jgi:hypothetical protein
MGVQPRPIVKCKTPLPVDNWLKTVDKPGNLGKTRSFVRLMAGRHPPIYGGIRKATRITGFGQFTYFWLGYLFADSPFKAWDKIECFLPYISRTQPSQPCIWGKTCPSRKLSTYPQALLRLLLINIKYQCENNLMDAKSTFSKVYWYRMKCIGLKG